jgi:hypothetical protein
MEARFKTSEKSSLGNISFSMISIGTMFIILFCILSIIYDENFQKINFKKHQKTMISKNELIKNSRNKEYVSRHLKDYSELLYHEFHEKTKFYENPNLILERYDVFDFLMQMIRKDEFSKLYNSIVPLSREHRTLIQCLVQLENQLFKT